MSQLGSSNFMKPISFAGGIFSSDWLQNLDFYNWNKVYVRYCDGASFSGDAEGENQNVRKVLPKDCLVNKNPTECFFPAELIKSIHTPMFVLNSGYDSWQVRNVLAPGSSSPDKSWLSCKDNIWNCNSTQIEILDGFRKTMVDELKVAQDKDDWGLLIDPCFIHCQTIYGISWNSPILPRIGNKTIAEAVGDWHFGRSQGVKEIDCEYPCNPTCSLLPT